MGNHRLYCVFLVCVGETQTQISPNLSPQSRTLVLAHRFRPTASFSLEVTWGTKTDRFSETASVHRVGDPKPKPTSFDQVSLPPSSSSSSSPFLPSCPWAIYLFPIITFPLSVTRGDKPTADRRSKVKHAFVGIRSTSWEISPSSNPPGGAQQGSMHY